MNPIKVLFVCSGNICRSPMAEGVFKALVAEAGLAERFEVASAGTGGWHVGEGPHPGTVRELAGHGISLGGKTARKVRSSDLERYDYIVLMDRVNVVDMLNLFGRNFPRLLEFAGLNGHEAEASQRGDVLDVPDPYYAGNFDEVYRLVRLGCVGLLAEIREQEGF
jgi:protein-tyrosine phosphatase